MSKYVLVIVCLLGANPAFATIRDLDIAARVDVARWHVSDSVLECRLTQPLPLYGEAVFSRPAGEGLRFFLATHDNPLRAGIAELVSQPPEWAPARPPIHMSEVKVERSAMPIKLGDELASRMIAELLKGMAPRFLHIAWYHAMSPVEVSVSPVYFQDAYQQYLHCLQGLLPASFAQLRRSQVNFETDKADLSPAAVERLDLIARFAAADNTVSKIVVQGYTDSVWESEYNYDLSRRRAQVVAGYLLAQGVDKKKIVRHHHGEHNPVASNDSAENRAKNRRVTIRLERPFS